MMAVNKIELNGVVVLDLTADTVTPDTLGEGITAHDAAGNLIVGTGVIGGGTADVTIYGGANEIITYSGKESGTFTLGSAGSGTIVLPKGTYTFTAGLSNLSVSKACDGPTDVRLRPDHYIYWYGAINGVIEKYDGYGTLTFQDNTLTLQGGYQDWAAISSDIDCSQDTKMSAKCTTVTSATYSNLLYSSYKNYSGGDSKDLRANATVTLTYTYASNKRARLAVYQNTNKIIVREWYLGNREGA